MMLLFLLGLATGAAATLAAIHFFSRTRGPQYPMLMAPQHPPALPPIGMTGQPVTSETAPMLPTALLPPPAPKSRPDDEALFSAYQAFSGTDAASVKARRGIAEQMSGDFLVRLVANSSYDDDDNVRRRCAVQAFKERISPYDRSAIMDCLQKGKDIKRTFFGRLWAEHAAMLIDCLRTRGCFDSETAATVMASVGKHQSDVVGAAAHMYMQAMYQAGQAAHQRPEE